MAVPDRDPDPRVVRCGVDDRPRSVTSALDADSGERSAKRAPADVAAPPIPMPFPLQQPVPTASALPVPPMKPRANIALGDPRAASGVLPPEVAAALAKNGAPYLDCDGLAKETDEGAFELRVSLATGGAALTIAPPPAVEVTPYLRCLVERSCQVRGAESAPAVDVILPLRITWAFPHAKPTTRHPEGGAAPFVVFEGVTDSSLNQPFFTYLRTMTRQTARTCLAGRMLLSGARARAHLKIGGTSEHPTLSSVTAEALGPSVDDQLLACMSDQIKLDGLLPLPKGFNAPELAVVVDFD
jgi:hypothetical protein